MSVVGPVEYCPKCRAEYLPPVKKFNGGNPIWVSYPSCVCAEERLEADIERRLSRSKEGT